MLRIMQLIGFGAISTTVSTPYVLTMDMSDFRNTYILMM